MSEKMPERIWAWDAWGDHHWSAYGDDFSTEYVRADLLKNALAEIERLQARIDKFVADFTTNA